MKRNVAFRFIPELLGDIEHVMELSENTNMLYVDAAVNTLRAATDVFQTFEEYGNTKRKRETLESIRNKCNNLENTKIKNYHDEMIIRLNVEYKKVQSKIKDGDFRDQEVRSFIEVVQKDLEKTIGIFQEMQNNPDYPDRTRVEEITRRALRDYKKLLTIYIEEDN